LVTAPPPQISLVNANGAGDVMAARLFYDLVRQPGCALTDRLQAALVAGAAYAAAPEAEI
jgi:sugar/nucleoside kinase (ribokinase family)